MDPIQQPDAFLSENRDRRPVKKMAVRFMLSIAFLATLIAFNYTLSENRIESARFISSVMDNIGRQYTLTQRIALLSRSLVDSPYPSARAIFSKELVTLAKDLESAHEDLIRGDLSKKLPRSALAKVHQVYSTEPNYLDRDMKRLVSAARQFAGAQGEDLNMENPYFLYIHSLAQSDSLVKALNKVIIYVKDEVEKNNQRNVHLARLQMGVFLLILAGMAVFIFFPMALQLRKEVAGLQKINDHLDQKAKELVTSNKKLLDKENALIGIMEDLAVQKKALQTEVTERVKAEKALQEEKATAQKYLDIAGVMILLIDSNQNVRLINKKGLQILNCLEDDVLGKNYFDHFLEAESREEIRALYNGFFSGEKDTVDYIETEIVRKDGSRRTIAWNITYLKDENGRITATLSSGEDITDRRMAEEGQKALMKKLAAANRELNDFSYVVSHDLKAPLRGIGSLATWIATDYKDKLDSEAQESLDLLIGRVKRMQDLIDGLLQLAKVGRTEGEPQDIDLNKLVPSVVDFINPPKNILITIERNLPNIHYDPTRIQQVFQNLLSNAVKYMDKPDGKIRVSWSEADGYWRFSVKDNGPGIDKKHHEKVFQIFQTLVPKDSFESTGIGLSLVKKIVESYGGRVWIESEVGKGCDFIFTLPKTEARVLAHAA